MIYSIGYGGTKNGVTLDELEHVLAKLNAALVDVRAKPFSRFRPEFRQAAMAARLGNRYRWHGDLLGGPGGGGAVTETGLGLLRTWHREGQNLVLMCQEHAPAECHRHTDIALALIPDIDVVHIFANELVLASELERSMRDDNDYKILGDSPLA